ncbi:hypothetical protein EDD90_2693 [Streptomyces sp. Ag109_O5-1]|nr:hypothetical protein EDD90_2693 [Streptomyces sp. Ag109_O5-1]
MLETCQVVAAGSTFANVVVVPSSSLSVNEPVSDPVSVRSSEPGSGFQPPAEVAVNPVSLPSTSTRATEVAEVWRTSTQSESVICAVVPEVH